MPASPSGFAGIDQLSTPVLLLDAGLRVVHANPAAENLFAFSARQVRGQALAQVFVAADSLLSAVDQARRQDETFTGHELTLATHGRERLLASCTVTPLEAPPVALALEFHAIDQQVRIEREERMLQSQQANRELIRSLAHEIKNPLGGIRGAAQLLGAELARPELAEYTRVIIDEADRLQSLVDRLLAPHRLPRFQPVNIHEVLERVRSLVLAETPAGIAIRRDYDTSLPELNADREQLIQVFLNLVRNAAQALRGDGEIILRTRVARQLTIARKRHRLAIAVQVIDNGPGIPAEIRERMFFPLVSGREDGSGLGLTLAQTYVSQHQGIIECDSAPGRTCFSVLLPLTDPAPT